MFSMAKLAEDCGLASHRPASTNARAGLQRTCRLDAHHRGEGRGEDSGDRQRRYHDTRDAVGMFRETGCDAIMIGRAASSNPWIFRQIAEYVRPAATTRRRNDRYEIMRRYYTMLAIMKLRTRWAR